MVQHDASKLFPQEAMVQGSPHLHEPSWLSALFALIVPNSIFFAVTLRVLKWWGRGWSWGKAIFTEGVCVGPHLHLHAERPV